MIKFIIVEDEKLYISKINNIVNKVMFNNNDTYEVVTYDDGSGLKNEIQNNSFQKVYIIDIELKGGVSGLDIAKMIRKDDWDSEIIFVTVHDKMFETVYRSIFKVFDFIEKFHNMDARLEKDLKTIVSKKFDNSKFLYVNNKINMQIYLKDILYIYRDTVSRKLVIKTNNNSFLINMSIFNILEKLDNRFKQVHRACIVNTDHVSLYNWAQGYFTLDTNEKVDMCSKNYKGDKHE